jgi:hypothetical protein
MTEIMKDKVCDARILEGRFPGPFKLIEGLSIEEKNAIGMQSYVYEVYL